MKTASLLVAALMLAGPALADQKVDDAYKKAEDQIQKGRPEEAVKTVQKVVDQNPTSSEAYLALGRIQDKTGASDAATTSFAKAGELAGSATPAVKSQVLAGIAARDLMLGSGKDALAHGEAAVAAEASPQALAMLARAQVRTGDATKGLETADKAVQAGATVAQAHVARGEALLGLHKTDDAVAAFRKAVELDPKLTHARVVLASALVAAGKAAEAVVEAKKATETDQKSAEAFAELGAAMLAQNPKEWNAAIAQAQQGAFLSPHSAEVQYIVGKIFEADGNLAQSAIAYKKAIEVDPGYVPAQSALIDVQVRQGDLEGASKAAAQLAKQSPLSGEAQLQLGRILLRKGDFAGAVPALEAASKLAPGIAEAHASLGTAYQFMRRSPDAVAAYKKAVELAPDNLDYRTTYGLLLGITDQAAAGAAELVKVTSSPAGAKNPAAWMNLGWVYRNMKPPKTEESVAAYKKALELDPKNEQAALGMGWAYSYSRMWDQSIAAFESAIKIDPKVAGEAYNGTAWCFYFKKDMAKAKEYLEKAAAAGRTDAHLKEQVEKIEKLLAANKAAAEEAINKTEGPKGEQGPDIGTLVANMQSAKVPVRLQAMRDCRMRECVPYLSSYGLHDADVDVRISAANGLGSLGSGAREALGALQKIAASPMPVPQLDAPPAVMAQEAKEGDFRRAVKAAIDKIQR